MRRERRTTDAARPTLQHLLGRIHFRVTLLAIGMTGLTVILTGLFVIRSYEHLNLRLVAQSVAYTAEAAIVFDDSAAAEEALAPLSAIREVANVSILRRDGSLLAGWERPATGLVDRAEQWVGRFTFPSILHIAVQREGQFIGEVQLHGSGSGLAKFLASALVGAVICFALATLASVLLVRHLQRRIVGPLHRLAAVAHAVRGERAFDRRVPPAAIAEIDELGRDFNALLDELQSWQGNLQRENAALAHLATHDSLTGLPNRAYFEGRLSRAINDARAADERVALLFLDNDGFKETNDRFGHAAGDAVLAAIAARIRGQIRTSDTVARLGGDEFAVLLPAVGGLEDAGRIADDIQNCIEKPITLPSGDEITPSVSIGMALFPDHTDDPTDLLHKADVAMYATKGRTRRRAAPTPQHL